MRLIVFLASFALSQGTRNSPSSVTKADASSGTRNQEFAHNVGSGTEYYGWDKDGTGNTYNTGTPGTGPAGGAYSNKVPRWVDNSHALSSSVGNNHNFNVANNDHNNICSGGGANCCEWNAVNTAIKVPKGYAGPGFGDFSCKSYHCVDTNAYLQDQPSRGTGTADYTEHTGYSGVIKIDGTETAALISNGFMPTGATNYATEKLDCSRTESGCTGTTCRFVKKNRAAVTTYQHKNDVTCTYADYMNATTHTHADFCVLQVKTHHDDIFKTHSCGMVMDTISDSYTCKCTCTGSDEHLNAVGDHLASPGYDQ